MRANIYSAEEIDKIRQSAKITGGALDLLESKITPGMTTGDLDKLAEDFIRSHGGLPAFKGYHGFTGTICASVNDEVVHGIPGPRVLKEGDIIGVDMGTILDGFFSDSCRSLAVGSISEEKQRLLDVTRESLYLAIEEFYEGNRLYTLSNRVQKHAESAGYGVVKDYVGHGIGYELHEEPQIPNFGIAGTGPQFKVGMVIAVEPMINLGTDATRVLDDGWTVVTQDGQPSAHFEHTIALTEKGAEILTYG